MKFGKMNKDKKALTFNILLVLAVLILGVVFMKYNRDKVTVKDSLTSLNPSSINGQSDEESEPYSKVENLGTKVNTEKSCNQAMTTDPSDLLPKQTNNEWSSMNPVTADLKNINLLSAGANYGINTVGSSLRNPNLQLRSEPIIPKTNAGPWNNTTIEADTHRRALEIDGCD
jgi:cell division protein FtsL